MEILKSDRRHYMEDDGGETIAEITFVPSNSQLIIIDHTFVDDSFRGQGIASKLVASAVDMAREQNKKVIPLCPFAKREFEKNPDYQTIQANRF